MSNSKGFVIHHDKKLTSPVSLTPALYQGMARATAITESAVGQAHAGRPVSLLNTKKGYITDSFLNRVYNKLYITPGVVDVGYISTHKTITFSIFNGYFTANTLTRITYSDDNNIRVIGATLPLLFGRLTTRTLVAEIAGTGSDIINCVITFHFLNKKSITLTIKGNRSLPLDITPNWANGIIEKLNWRTNIHQSQTGAEQRVSMRLTPRRTFEFQIMIYQSERQRVETTLFNHYGSTFSLPIFSDISLLDTQVNAGDSVIALDTRGRDYRAGGHIMLTDAHITTVVEILALDEQSITLTEPITAAFNCGAKVFPVKSAKLTDPPQITRKTDELSTAELRFIVVESNRYDSITPLPTYRGFYVLEHEPDWADDISASYESLRQEIDNQTGVPYYFDTAGRVFAIQSYSWVVYGRQEQQQLRTLFYALRGRQKPIFIPSFSNDCHLTDNATNDYIDIRYNGMPETDKPGQFIRVLLVNREIVYREILNVKSNDAGGLRLMLNEKMNFRGDEVVKISLMRLCRLNDDTVTWEHLTDADGTARVTVNFKEVRYELE